MKFALLVLLVSFLPSANAAAPRVSGDIAEVVSVDSWKDTKYVPNVNPYFRFRAIKFDPLEGENGGKLVVEKLYRGGEAMPYETRFSKEIEMLPTKAMKERFEMLPYESKLGCCSPYKMKWDGFKLLYSMMVNRVQFDCVIENVNKSQSPVCKRIN